MDQLAFVTSSGFVEKPVGSRRAGGRGQTTVVSDLGVMRSDPVTHELELVAVHPGVTVEQVRENTGWELKVSASIHETEAPSTEELRVLRDLQQRTLAAHGGMSAAE